MKTFVLNLSDSATAFLWKEVKIRCDIPVDTDCVKVIGTIDFKNVEFDREFYNAIKGKIDILDLSEL